MKSITLFFLLGFSLIISQPDTTKYPWPLPPFNSSRSLTATFGEFRNTGSSDHFHNAVDISEPAGNPVYPCINGTVYSISDNGYNSYINVKTIINGKKKHITYYHVIPSPSLSVGQNVVTGTTVLGTIEASAGHVHLIERELLDPQFTLLGTPVNPIRPDGGLDPYYDTYSPVISSSSLTFYKDNTSIPVPKDQLNGKIDIVIDVREKNGTSTLHNNNGTYILGYRVLSEDGQTIIYEPEDNGMKYRFYYLPGDEYVHNVFVQGKATLSDPIYWLTNGKGEAFINSYLSVSNNYIDTDLLDEGNYLLEIFTEDTRSNTSSKQFPITIQKLPPELVRAVTRNDSLFFSWYPYNLKSLLGYRLYYSELSDSNNWYVAADETTLNSETNDISFESASNFLIPTNTNSLKFYLTAVDSSGTESNGSDIYTVVKYSGSSNNYLIVDGFDRYGGNGSWPEPTHKFNTTYASAVLDAVGSCNISSSSNEAVLEEKISLNDYQMVIWFLGDESSADNTLDYREQYEIVTYLLQGGKLLISGEDIGKDLDTQHSNSEILDTLFYHQYMKSNLIHDGNDLLFEVNGQEGSLFEGLNVKFGEIYPSDAPDDIEPVNGAAPILNYTYMRDDTTYRKGGIAYTGSFGTSSIDGAIVYLSFPFETIASEETRSQLMNKIQRYFGFNIVNIDEKNNFVNIPENFELKQNYPNPFNPSTTISYNIPLNKEGGSSNVKLIIYDILGAEITTLVNKPHKAGSYSVVWGADKNSSGIYFYRLITDTFIETKKMVLVR